MAPRKIIFVFVLMALCVPLLASAAPHWWPIVPCGLNRPTEQDVANGDALLDDSYYESCNQCTLIKMGKNLIDFTFQGVVPMVGTMFFVVAGFLILVGGATGKPAQVKQGQGIFKNTIFGVAIIASSWLVASFILKSLATDDVSNKWYEISCTVGSLSDLTGVPELPGPPPPGPVPPSSGGTQCQFSGVNLCDARSMTCTASACGQYAATVNRYASGAATANLLKAIMMKESSCRANADSGHAQGLMQMKSSTANQFRSYCGLSGVTITGSWLKTHPTESVCLAAAYVRSLAAGSCGSDVRNIAAGYNGGPGACRASVSCAQDTSCSNNSVRKWECLYDNTQHTRCNTGYNETRDYATKVMYCNNNPGF